MDDLQGGFQTAPVKLPFTPYQKAVSARESIVQIIKQQMDAISGGKVCSTCLGYYPNARSHGCAKSAMRQHCYTYNCLLS